MFKFAVPLAIALSALPGLASAASRSAGPTVSAPHVTKSELQAFRHVRLTADEAIAAARKHGGGKALEVGFADSQGRPYYRVSMLRGRNIWQGRVDADSGRITGQGTIRPAQFGRSQKLEAAALRKARTRLVSAIRDIEQKSGGRAIAAGLAGAKGRMAYEVETVKGGALRDHMVDPVSGAVSAGRFMRMTQKS